MTDELIFPPHKGWDPFAPTRTLPPDGASYRDMQNFRLGDAFLRRRATVDVISKPGAPDQLPVLRNKTGLDNNGVEYVLHLFGDPNRSNPQASGVWIAITNYRVLINFNSHGSLDWYTINPQIDSGTGMNYAATSTLVTGVFQTGNTYPIVKNDLLVVDDETVVGVVASYNGGLGQVTLQEAALTTGVATDWSIRKSIRQDRAHYRFFNGDLYVAAAWEGITDLPGDGRQKWGVYRWSQVMRYPVDGDFSERVWLCASAPFDGDPFVAADSPPAPLGPPPPYRQVLNNPNGNQTGIPNNLIDYDATNFLNSEAPDRVRVKGLDLLQDGRVVVPIASDRYDDRIFYSSQINDPQIHWNTSPGGFVDPVGIQGEINVMGRLGNQLTLHYLHGIAVATPTGQDDPPLSFQNTRELQGCTFWRTLTNINPAIETFMGPDKQLYTFNGSAVDLIGAHPKVAFPGTGVKPIAGIEHFFFTSWDGYERELSVWYWRGHTPVQDNKEETYRAVFNFDKGAWTRDTWNFFITAVSRDYGSLDRGDEFLQTDREQYAMVGLTNRNRFAVQDEYQDILRYLGELRESEYQPPWIVQDNPSSYVEFDNYGLGEQTIEIERVGVELLSVAGFAGATQEVLISPIFDANPAAPENRTVVLGEPQQSKTYYFQNFNNNSGEKLRLRIELLPQGFVFRSALGTIRLGINPVGEVVSEGQDVD